MMKIKENRISQIILSILVAAIGLTAVYFSSLFILSAVTHGTFLEPMLMLWIVGVVAGFFSVLYSGRLIWNIHRAKPAAMPRPGSLAFVGTLGVFQLISAYVIDALVVPYMIFTAAISFGFFALAAQQVRLLKRKQVRTDA